MRVLQKSTFGASQEPSYDRHAEREEELDVKQRGALELVFDRTIGDAAVLVEQAR